MTDGAALCLIFFFLDEAGVLPSGLDEVMDGLFILGKVLDEEVAIKIGGSCEVLDRSP